MPISGQLKHDHPKILAGMRLFLWAVKRGAVQAERTTSATKPAKRSMTMLTRAGGRPNTTFYCR
jgi:hypothetical protein